MERSYGTWQGRLPQELRLAGIPTLEAANRFFREHYIQEFNRKFAVKAALAGTAFRKLWIARDVRRRVALSIYRRKK